MALRVSWPAEVPACRAGWPQVGELAPWFRARTHTNPKFAFDTAAGRAVVLCFFGSAAEPAAAEVLAGVWAQAARFDDLGLCFFGISIDAQDEQQHRIADAIPGRRIVWDQDLQLSARYGVLQPDGDYRQATLVLDAMLQVIAVLPFGPSPAAHLAALWRVLDALPPRAEPRPAAVQAPVLVLPRIFEPALCAALIAHYARHGGEDSGVMREVDGQTVEIQARDHKRRRDCLLDEGPLMQACKQRIHDRLAPALKRVFQFEATRIERYLVACYDAADQGAFAPHRDNTTRGTAHRRFAVSLFLNTGAYAGGQLRFPEFGPALFSAPPGGAVVFSCSMLHEALPVTRGQRYMFLPFLYDETGRRIRDENLRYVAPESRIDPG